MNKSRLFVFAFAFWLIFCSAACAGEKEPVVFFSDLVSGPSRGGEGNLGCFVTIWGRHFGSEQNDSYVTVGEGRVARYPVWSDDKITFQPGPDAKSGEIVVVTARGESNGIPFGIRGGAVRFISPHGDDYQGDGSREYPWGSLFHAKRFMRPGDILYIMDGFRHTEEDAYGAYLNLDSSGNASLPKAIVAYPGARVEIGGDGLGRCFHNWISGDVEEHYSKYWVISQLILRSSGSVVELGEGFRVVGNTISAPRGSGATAAIHGRGPNAKVLGNTLVNVGYEGSSKLYHSIYINNNWKGSTTSNIEIAWNHIHRSQANRGIQIYAGNHRGFISNVSIHDNLIHHVRGNAINVNNHVTGTITIYNNVIYKAGLGPDFSDGISNYSGILISPEKDATVYFFHNLVYDCGYAHRPGGSGLLAYRRGTLYAINNVFVSGGNMIEPGSGIPVAGKYGNLFFGNIRPQGWDKTGVYGDPRFTDISSFNFRPLETSAVIDRGRRIKSQVGRRDYDGLPRPQGAGFDIGPFEVKQ
ncbi:MAG: IPT/TIG domain-containing protein [Candidatus Omnitrophica bacterium]|nr:IPT/TIG domain-containing protein [Candidatus Omnitrophota bacterium]